MLYLEQMEEDVINAIKWNYEKNDWIDNREGLEEKLNDDLWIDDSVTGNASGSYFFNSFKSREMVISDGLDYFKSACEEFCIPSAEIGEKFINEEWEYIDVTIRCYLLSQVIAKVLDDMEENGYFDSEEKEEKTA